MWKMVLSVRLMSCRLSVLDISDLKALSVISDSSKHFAHIVISEFCVYVDAPVDLRPHRASQPYWLREAVHQ